MKSIYLDHAAATDILPTIREKISQESWLGNPSSGHIFGQKNKQILDETRYTASKIFECDLEEVTFTSGATEAIHLAIVGRFLGASKKEKYKILVSPLSHSSIWGALTFLKNNFDVHWDILPITNTGEIDIEACKKISWESYDQIVVEHGNSEVGILQPVAKIGKILQKFHREYPDKNIPFFIVDAAASVVSQKISLRHQVCDALIISGEKFGAFPGTGLLIHTKHISLEPFIRGSQELGVRGGTENVLGIYSLGEALRALESSRGEVRKRLEQRQEQIRTFFDQYFPAIPITTPEKNHLPHIFHFQIPFGEASLFVQQCDMEGLAVSAGTACASGNVGGSTVLHHLGLSESQSRRGVRISFGRTTTSIEVEQACVILQKILKRGVDQ